ncbi:MAG: hypothetical protein IKT70_07620 [Clostridia bacterium]|nr:hypothetical protein [Clostridia bacterium]
MEGTFDKYDSEYKIALSYALSVSTPNAAYVGMSQFDAMIDNHMKKNGFLKYFSDPYFGFKPYIIRQD